MTLVLARVLQFLKLLWELKGNGQKTLIGLNHVSIVASVLWPMLVVVFWDCSRYEGWECVSPLVRRGYCGHHILHRMGVTIAYKVSWSLRNREWKHNPCLCKFFLLSCIFFYKCISSSQPLVLLFFPWPLVLLFCHSHLAVLCLDLIHILPPQLEDEPLVWSVTMPYSWIFLSPSLASYGKSSTEKMLI